MKTTEEKEMVEEIATKLSASHVISFQNEDGEWAGYSPSNGLYWVADQDFQSPREAASVMYHQGGNWRVVDQCIDDEEVA